jgi:hypothetical protein
MIIQVDSATAANTEAAKRSLEALAHAWGCEIAGAPAEATAPAGTRDKESEKGIDLVSVASLALSIPSAALAVQDLADRIRKRRRAKELIDHAQQLAAQNATLSLVSRTSTVEIRTLDPDQLLDLLDGDDPAS